MSWFGVDPKMWRSGKRFRASTAAMGLWSMAGSWSRDEKTSGFVPQGALKAISPDLPDDVALALAEELVAAKVEGIHEHGLWIPMANGWQFNDWEDWQGETEGESEKAARIKQLRREAGLRGAQARWQKDAPEDGKTDGKLAKAIGGTRARFDSDSEVGRKEASDPEDSRENLTGQEPLARNGKPAVAIDDEPKADGPFKTPAERESFAYWADMVWRKLHPKGEPRASKPRLTPFRARLREGATPAEFKIACTHVAESRFHFGENDTGRTHIEPKTLFGSAEKLETWLAKKAPAPKSQPGATPADRELAERDGALLAEIKRGDWGERVRTMAAERERQGGKFDLRRFREAIHAGSVKRVQAGSSPEASAGPPRDVRELTIGVGRAIRS